MNAKLEKSILIFDKYIFYVYIDNLDNYKLMTYVAGWQRRRRCMWCFKYRPINFVEDDLYVIFIRNIILYCYPEGTPHNT